MTKISVKNIKNEKVQDLTLTDSVWNIEVNNDCLKKMIKLQLAAQRQGTAKTKTRAEVSGGGKKPWKQKGTGNARQGSIRATQWRGGGIVFGPQPRDYSKKMNKKERRLALLSALSYKLSDNELVVVDSLTVENGKTKEMVAILDKLNLMNYKTLIVVNELDEKVCLAARNLANTKIVLVEEVNTYDVVNADKMVITEAALNKLEEVLGNE